MGMAGPDIVLFVIGAILFGGAVTALVVQGGGIGALSGSPTGVYTVDYATSSKDVAKQAVADLSSAKANAQVTLRNVSALHVQILCTDTVPAALPAGQFNLRVEVQPPAGIPAPKAVFGQCGANVKVDVPVASVPARTSAQGSTEDAARASLGSDANETKALGAWTVTVSGSRGGQVPVGGTPAAPGGSIVLTADVWAPTLTAVAK